MSRATSSPQYWLSASVLTIMSAPSRQALSSPCHEGSGQPLVLSQAHDVVYAQRFGDLCRAICAAVVNDQPLDLVHARQTARKLC